ncbi:MAG TPA: YcxB family protein [Verrucomicrobiae bacterium]|nr:YcxB family protein [Verrucomicrobiae bacterium]
MNPPPIPNPVISSVKYTLTRWDLLQFRMWYITHNRPLVILMLMASAIPPLIALGPLNVVQHSSLVTTVALLIMTGIMLGIMIVIQLAFHWLLLLLNKNRGVLGNHEVELREDGLLGKSPTSESFYRWSGFRKVQASSRYLIIFVTDGIVYCIPLRYFPSPEEARRFQEEIRRRMGRA